MQEKSLEIIRMIRDEISMMAGKATCSDTSGRLCGECVNCALIGEANNADYIVRYSEGQYLSAYHLPPPATSIGWRWLNRHVPSHVSVIADGIRDSAKEFESFRQWLESSRARKQIELVNWARKALSQISLPDEDSGDYGSDDG